MVIEPMHKYDSKLYEEIVHYYQQSTAPKNDTNWTSQSRTNSSAVKYAESTDHSV
jgi:hypothetical protein